MAIQDYDLPSKQIFRSNILLIICCIFYLAWWLLAFKPSGGLRGIKSGWLLIPAFVAGVLAVILASKGITSAPAGTPLFPGKLLIWGGVAVYLILLVVTGLVLKRQITTELFLIVGWAVLALSEINTLYGTGRFTYGSAIILAVVIGIAILVSLVCYMLYYNLGERARYFDGMVPLVLIALVSAGISIAI